ncbi:hypothetical protein GIB67_011094 [Kingdonia uniflora]|uniref:Uncharacterized protein n=1 Tax=Kingdonia uniflora TaxID=39325 RepID=A0A7J7LKE4_9MAGN|nr:hypothetical protein GIB67_011094 [Kingdonia uniflora]
MIGCIYISKNPLRIVPFLTFCMSFNIRSQDLTILVSLACRSLSGIALSTGE